MNRHLLHALASAGLTIAAVTAGTHLVNAQAAPPHYAADLAWPKPLPNRWVLGGLGGLCVDAQGHAAHDRQPGRRQLPTELLGDPQAV